MARRSARAAAQAEIGGARTARAPRRMQVEQPAPPPAPRALAVDWEVDLVRGYSLASERWMARLYDRDGVVQRFYTGLGPTWQAALADLVEDYVSQVVRGESPRIARLS